MAESFTSDGAKPERPSTADAVDALVDILAQTSFALISIVTRIGAEHDLSLTQVRMLGIMRDRTLTMAGLADYLGLERSTISGLVDRAERRGLVRRQANAVDRRSTELVLTPAGLELAQVAAGSIAERVAPIVEELPEPVRAALPSLLEAMQAGPLH